MVYRKNLFVYKEQTFSVDYVEITELHVHTSSHMQSE